MEHLARTRRPGFSLVSPVGTGCDVKVRDTCAHETTFPAGGTPFRTMRSEKFARLLSAVSLIRTFRSSFLPSTIKHMTIGVRKRSEKIFEENLRELRE